MKSGQAARLPQIHSLLLNVIAFKCADPSQAGVCVCSSGGPHRPCGVRVLRRDPRGAPRGGAPGPPTSPSGCCLRANTQQPESLWEALGPGKWRLSLAAGPLRPPALRWRTNFSRRRRTRGRATFSNSGRRDRAASHMDPGLRGAGDVGLRGLAAFRGGEGVGRSSRGQDEVCGVGEPTTACWGWGIPTPEASLGSAWEG